MLKCCSNVQILWDLIGEFSMENTALPVTFGLGLCTRLCFLWRKILNKYPFCRKYFWPDFVVILSENPLIFCAAGLQA